MDLLGCLRGRDDESLEVPQMRGKYAGRKGISMLGCIVSVEESS
jgi:hypothetical protein